MGTSQAKPIGDQYAPTGATEGDGSVPPPPPSEPSTPMGGSPAARRSSLRASFSALFGSQAFIAPEEPKPPPIDLNRLDVPKKDNHPYHSFRVSKKIGQ